MSITLDNVGSGFKRSVINDNFDKIETELNTETVKKDGSVAMTGDLNAGGNKLYNVEELSTDAIVINNIDITDPEQLRGPEGVAGPIGLTGPTGIQGPIGLTGPEGPVGPQGAQGIQGVQGPQGVVGPQGADGTSYEVFDTLSITDLMSDLTTSIPDNRGYLVESYAPISLGSETNGFIDVKIAHGGNTTGTWHMYWNPFGSWSDDATTWKTYAVDIGSITDIQGTISGDYVLFTTNDYGSGLLSDNGVEIFYEPAGYVGDYTDLPILYQTAFTQTPITLDGTTPLATNAIGGYLFIKDGTGTLSSQTSTVNTRLDAAYSNPLPFGVGPTGIQGPEGIQGPQGPQGAVGPTGAQGPQGAVGPTGAQGPAGDQGVRGSRSYYVPDRTSWDVTVANNTIPGDPLQYDIVTQYDDATGFSESRSYDGTVPSTSAANWDVTNKMTNFMPVIIEGAPTSLFADEHGRLALGEEAGLTTQGEQALAIGQYAGRVNQGTQAVAIGRDSGYNQQGAHAIALGKSAGAQSQGQQAIAIGPVAGTTGQGQDGVAIGYGSGEYLQGSQSVAIGSFAGKTSQGTLSVAIGYKAAETSLGDGSVAIGWQANQTGTGTTTVAVGYLSKTGANETTAVGPNSFSHALRSTSLGWQCHALGNYSLAIGSGVQTEGTGSTAIGGLAAVGTDGTGSTVLGYNAESYHASSTVLGKDASATGANQFVLGAANITNLRCNDTSISSLSDERDKTEIVDCPYGLDYINQLRPVKFKWDYRTENFTDGVPPTKHGTEEVGFIAQELAALQDGEDASCLKTYQHYEPTMDETGAVVRPDTYEADVLKLFPVLVKAVQEQQVMIEQLQQQVASLGTN